MTFVLKIFFITFITYNVQSNNILIPFNIFVNIQKYNNSLFQKDILSLKYLEDIYISLSLGNPIQTIKLLLRLDQYEIIIKEPNYNSSSSSTFKLNKFIENRYICNDSFHLVTINSSKELNDFIHKDKKSQSDYMQKKYKEYEDIKFVYLNNTTSYKFLERDFKDEEIDKIKLYNYGMIGLRLRHKNDNNSPDLIKNLRELKHINSNIFTFLFTNNNKKEDNYGYLIIGDKFTDIEKEFEETNNSYFALRDASLSWDLRTEIIYSQPKENLKNNFFTYLEDKINVELIIEKSFILGTKKYKSFIENLFFNDLVKENICQYKNLVIEQSVGTYVCNGKSKVFLEYYNNIFPNLIFKCNNIGELILTKKDLFFYNENNKSDTNVYFLIYFSTIFTTKWMLGRPFFEKYRFSFNIDTNFIMYHKKKIDEIDFDKIVKIKINNKNNRILKIIAIIFLVIIIFLLGFLFHKSIIKIPRKQKANELDDEFDYSLSNDKNKKLNNDFDINNNNPNKNNLYLELGTKNINSNRYI